MRVIDPIQLALAQAELAIPISSPNPRVGCVIVGADGQLLGSGSTQAVGGPHAEVMALRALAAAGHSAQGATAYVTLEPCSHTGRTGPCCDALVAAGIRRVVASIADPNPLVQGRGFARLRAAGVEVEIGPGAAAARELNLGFFSRMLRHTPWVRVKAAISLDGRTALNNGVSQWITGEAARQDGHAWRARACAVLTGIGTVRRDNPQLNVRHLSTPRQPHAVVVDSRLETPPDAALFLPNRHTFIYAAEDHPARRAALQARGATVVCLPGSHGVDLAAMLADLAAREINELHVEAGQTLNGALLRDGLVDELLVYQAPTLLGEGMGLAQWGPVNSLAQTVAMEFRQVERVGADLRLLARLQGRDRF